MITSKTRFFLRKDDSDLASRGYYYWTWGEEDGVCYVYYKDRGAPAKVDGWCEDRVTRAISIGSWVEIPASEAVLIK